MKKIACILGEVFEKIIKAVNYCRKERQKQKLHSCGKDVYIGAGCIMSEKNIDIGDNVYVGPRCVFQSTYGRIKIGSHVMFGPGVNIHGGNHKVRELGCYLDDVSAKKDGDDGVIVIEDDCWIGANAVILSNVTIGTGAVVGAGSIVTKDVPPYSIYTGTNTVKIRSRFDGETTAEHIELLKDKYGGK